MPEPEPLLADAAIPPALGAPRCASGARAAASWSPAELERLVRHLAVAGARTLERLPAPVLAAAWADTVARFRDPVSAPRRVLDAVLPGRTGLSPAGVAAGLDVVLRGVAGEPAARLLASVPAAAGRGLVAVFLAANLPGLALQPLLRALAARRPVLLKSPSDEPLFAPAFVEALVRRAPELADAVAAVTWRGGDQALEAPVLAVAAEVVAYGEEATLADLARRAGGKLRGHGPKASLAVVGPGAVHEEVAKGLARDVALFDQRGCLSVQAVYAPPDEIGPLAAALAAALQRIAEELPPGFVDPALAARVQQVRAETEMRGLDVLPLPLASGTVIIERDPRFRPSPGLRTVRLHPLDAADALADHLAPWAGRLQGVALAGRLPAGLRPALAALGVSRFAAAGELQAADANWENPAAALE